MKKIILLLCFGQLLAFDMWEVIMEKNKPKEGVQSDGNSARVVGGDIWESPQEERQKLVLSAPANNLRPVFTWHMALWQRNIPYIVKSSLSTTDSKEIKKALERISEISCLKFRPKYSSDKHWLEFYRGTGCFSGIGRKYWKTSATSISLGQGCVHSSIIIHEVFHALGFYHEQSRTDRDSMINVYLHNANTQMHSNFNKNRVGDVNYVGTEYDYKSIMHYSRTAFRKNAYVGNVMEAKFDPEMKFGGNELSPTDIKELNGLYQCDVASGWSNWAGWSRCLTNWRKQCTKANVRFCVSEDVKKCPGANEYGVQEDVKECTPAQCIADKNRQDGIWGNWGPYTSCDKTCGWGSQSRTRKCDNPTPNSGGDPCKGSSTQKTPCRITRCTKASQVDQNFETGFGGWKSEKFTRKYGKASSSRGGPAKDHTSEIKSSVKGWYAMADKSETRWSKVTAKLTSPVIYSNLYPGDKCLSFFYQMNGHNIPTGNVLSVYLKFAGNGGFLNLPFSKGGHQGNEWKKASIELKNMRKEFQIIIEVNIETYDQAIVAVDDILFDHKTCAALINEQNPCPDNHDKCTTWAKSGECGKNTWMSTNCCSSCEKYCSDNKAYEKQCPGWAKKGECAKNKTWMPVNCCSSCKKNLNGK